MNPPTRFLSAFVRALGLLSPTALAAPASLPSELPDLRWHLPARPWQPADFPERALLDQMERALRAMAPLQYWNPEDPKDANNGSIIDPFDKKEVQYGTPLFAFNVATLASRGRVMDLIEPAARAMDRSTRDITDGRANDYHGEFFCAPMVKAIRMLEKLDHSAITPGRVAGWKQRMKTGRRAFMDLRVKQNWRTFAMKGEWLRQQDGYIDDAVPWMEACWTEAAEGGQRERFRRDLDQHKLTPHFFLYHDDTADPETFAYNGATTANLLDSLESGYNGPSADEMRGIISRNLRASLLMMGGSGEAPGGGRTGEHIWGDSIYANAFAHMAEISLREGNKHLAGQYRRAVNLLLESHSRFQQENGWFSITKNQFHPSLKNRYASWSGIANYEGFTLACCAETLLATKSSIHEQATPAEIGGYAMRLDPEFASVFLNAGGMQAQLCTRGETDNYGNVQWHALGITRFSRSGWDGRLGPGAGHVNSDFSDGFSFSPAFLEDGVWKRVCLEPRRFEGRFTPEFVHPLLVRGNFAITPVAGQRGPSFDMRLTLTPDGALIDTTSGAGDFGVIWPLLEFDGRTVLDRWISPAIASTSYPRAGGSSKTGQAERAKTGNGARIELDPLRHPANSYVRLAKAGSSIEWTGLDGGEGGDSMIGFRYSLATDSQPPSRARLIVNNTPMPDLVFPSTGEGLSWHPLDIPVPLKAGAVNSVRVESIDTDRLLIDELRIHPASSAASGNDQQNFIALKDSHRLDTSAPSVRGGYGDFKPVRVTDSKHGAVETFVYPRGPGDPSAADVRASFKREGGDFRSVLGRVTGTLYAGRTAAGGFGESIDLDDDGAVDVTFGKPCHFIIRHENGRISAIETDAAVSATLGSPARKVTLAPFHPFVFLDNSGTTSGKPRRNL